ncbi:FecR family protein [Flexithrix dorotheae]|uniref:FecR family protein n=1 Tax=Flexithrix dorotheae TaxID=70993 RepID=UPI000360F01E|nr:FecR family protein [Flexithrix dorotheae]
MKYENYTVFEFLKDEEFQDWLKNPTPENNFYWESWIQNHPSKKDTILQAKELYRSISFKSIPGSKEDEDVIFENILRSKRPDSLNQQRKSGIIQVLVHQKTMGVAASLLVLLISVYFMWNYQNPPEEKVIDPELLIEKVVPTGSKLTLKLNDGTSVKLNAESKLRFPQHFSDINRVVYLEGEAFFDVKRDTLRPFIIKTGQTQTTVLGTSFNIRAYKGELNEQISVVTGKVLVKNLNAEEGDTLHLLPNQEAILNVEKNNLYKGQFKYEERLGWKEGKIYFEDAGFHEILSRLQRWYGVKIETNLTQKIEKGYTGQYENESLKTVLEAISFSLGFQFEIKDKKVRIYN